jgi:hypothetical protein
MSVPTSNLVTTEQSGKRHASADLPRYPLNGRLFGFPTRPGRFGDEINLLLLVGITGHAVRILVTIPNELSWLFLFRECRDEMKYGFLALLERRESCLWRACCMGMCQSERGSSEILNSVRRMGTMFLPNDITR